MQFYSIIHNYQVQDNKALETICTDLDISRDKLRKTGAQAKMSYILLQSLHHKTGALKTVIYA